MAEERDDIDNLETVSDECSIIVGVLTAVSPMKCGK